MMSTGTHAANTDKSNQIKDNAKTNRKYNTSSSSNQVFTDHTHLVAIRTSGNVYAYETVALQLKQVGGRVACGRR